MNHTQSQPSFERSIQRRVLISGKVQGVGFRASTVQAAKKFSDLRGYVRNLTDGRVEAVFSGPENEVLSMVAWCKHGPRIAEVQSLEVKEESYDTLLQKFSIHR